MQTEPANRRQIKKIAVICLVVVFAAFVAAMLTRGLHSQEQIQVVGDLEVNEVADIRAAVLKKMHPPIFPDFSVKSLRAAPGLILERFRGSKPQIWTIEARTHGFVAVFVEPTPSTPAHPYVFFGVFRETNSWKVRNEYQQSPIRFWNTYQ